MLLPWVLTLTRVTYLGKLDNVPVFFCPSKGESAVFGFSGSGDWWFWISLSFSSSSSMVPGRRNSFCGSSMPLNFLTSRLTNEPPLRISNSSFYSFTFFSFSFSLSLSLSYFLNFCSLLTDSSRRHLLLYFFFLVTFFKFLFFSFVCS